MDNNVAWAAGFFEGEGCFFLRRYQTKQGVKLAADASLNTTDKDVLERFHRVVGRGKIYVHRDADKPKKQGEIWKKSSWQWRCGSDDAIEVAKLLLPFLGERRTEKALEMIERHHTFDHVI
jgi:hypothetical protein